MATNGKKRGETGKTEGSRTTQFKPGNGGGPGRPPIPYEHKKAMEDIERMRGTARLDLQSYLDRHRYSSSESLKKLAETQAGNMPVLELMVVRALYKASQSASLKELSTVKVLTSGAEVKQVELSGPGGEPLNPLASKSPEQLIAAWDEVQILLKERECKSTENSPASSGSSPQSVPPSSRTESCAKK